MSPLPIIWKMKRFFNIGSEKKYREAIKVIDDFAMEIIRLKERELESKQEKGEVEYSRDLLSRFMGSTLNVGFGDQGEKRKFLKDIVISFVLAGMELIIFPFYF